MDLRIIKYYTKELSEDERRSLLQEAFSNDKLKKEMMDCQNLQSLMKLHTFEKNELSGKTSLNQFVRARKLEKRKRLLFSSLKYAAIFIIGVISTWWITLSIVDKDIPQPFLQQLSIPAGQHASIILPDGSKVWVNAGSTLTFPSIFGKERRVEIIGEAYFDVAKDSKPFIVCTGETDIRALGTQFNVFNYPKENLIVTLLKGSVKVYDITNKSQSVILLPDEQLTQKEGRFIVETSTKNPSLWREGLYSFDQENMKELLKKLELYYDVKITVKDPFIFNYEYTGKFRQRDGVMEVLRIIRKIHPFNIKQIENTNEIILYR